MHRSASQFALTAKLINAFVFALQIVQFLFFSKSKISSLYSLEPNCFFSCTCSFQLFPDLLYQWQKLQALASERRNQFQELKTMYATYLSIEGMLMDGVPETQRSKFKCLKDLQKTMKDIQVIQRFINHFDKCINSCI